MQFAQGTRGRSQADPERIISLASVRCDVSAPALVPSGARSKATSRARRVASHLARRLHGTTYRLLADEMGVTPSSVRWLLTATLDQHDAEIVDALTSELADRR